MISRSGYTSVAGFALRQNVGGHTLARFEQGVREGNGDKACDGEDEVGEKLALYKISEQLAILAQTDKIPARHNCSLSTS